jgi:hypothetical protein
MHLENYHKLTIPSLELKSHFGSSYSYRGTRSPFEFDDNSNNDDISGEDVPTPTITLLPKIIELL